MAAFAVLAALHHRRRTGEGQDIDLSSTEVIRAMMGHAFLDHQLAGAVPARLGNRDERMAPHGCYRCRDDGQAGSWVTIAVSTDAEWAAWRGVVKDEALDGPEFASAGARKRNEDALDERLESWTRERSAEEVVGALQAVGVAAGLLHSGNSLSEDPHVLARGVFVPITHPRLGTLRSVRPPWRMRGAALREPAPLLAQHNDTVLGEILGLTPEEIERLVAEQSVY